MVFAESKSRERGILKTLNTFEAKEIGLNGCCQI